ncbi:hypothetical protein GF325_15185 [Candidatus Bathyarchaeota archaeon]|nr:hypothetical protein [Candidatus Bathyarchaeota archaeon]
MDGFEGKRTGKVTGKIAGQMQEKQAASNLGGSFHYFMKAWFDGRPFTGSQVQPDQATVDGTLVESLHALGYLPAGSHVPYFKVAGRTDKGVSARAALYYIQVQRKFHPCEVNSWMRSQDHPISIWSVARLDGFVNPRKARSRTYLYFLPGWTCPVPVSVLERGMVALGGEYDFATFAKSPVIPGVETNRTLETSVETRRLGSGNRVMHVLHFSSTGFLREQIRRMVGFLLEGEDEGDNDGIQDIGKRVERAFASGPHLPVDPAPAENLVLWDVVPEENVRWENVDGCQAFTKDWMADQHEAVAIHEAQLSMMVDELPRAGEASRGKHK